MSETVSSYIYHELRRRKDTRIATLEAERDKWIEREALACPEGQTFEETIGALRVERDAEEFLLEAGKGAAILTDQNTRYREALEQIKGPCVGSKRLDRGQPCDCDPCIATRELSREEPIDG